MFVHKILIMGLPGSGKTTLASALARKLSAVHFNADEVRKEINSHLGFLHEDRVAQARTMGWLCDVVLRSGHYAVADFVCPTEETRNAFGAKDSYFMVWVDRITESRFADTNRIFMPPQNYDCRVTAGGSVDYWVKQITSMLVMSYPSLPKGTNSNKGRQNNIG